MVRCSSSRLLVPALSLLALAACHGSSSDSSTSFLAPGVNDLGINTPARFALRDGVLAASFLERGVDVNGDGDDFDEVLRIVDLASGARTLVPNVVEWMDPLVGAGFVTYLVPEAAEGRDLNLDGDTNDVVVHVHDVRSGSTRDLGLAVQTGTLDVVQEGDLVAVLAWEVGQGADLDGNGKLEGLVPCVFEPARGLLTTIPIATETESLHITGRRIVFEADEGVAGDLNHDGDVLDEVPQVFDLDTGVLRNTGVSCESVNVDGDLLALRVAEWQNGGDDLNGNGLADDAFVQLEDLATDRVRTTAGNYGAVLDVSGGLAILQLVDNSNPGPGYWGYDLASDTLAPFIVSFDPVVYYQLSSVADRRFAYLVLTIGGGGNPLEYVLHVFDGRTGTNTNTHEVALSAPYIDARRVAWLGQVPGSPGPLPPTSVRIHDFRTDATRDLGLLASDLRLIDEHVVALTPEAWAGRDLDRDGDRDDFVVQVRDLRSGRTVNTTVDFGMSFFDQAPLALDGDVLALEVGDRVLLVRLR